MAVPTLMLEVAWMAIWAVTKAELVVSAAQQDSKPAASTIWAIGPIMGIGPPIPIA
jgi:cytosine/uracil/thiamine/allantoin permease